MKVTGVMVSMMDLELTSMLMEEFMKNFRIIVRKMDGYNHKKEMKLFMMESG